MALKKKDDIFSCTVNCNKAFAKVKEQLCLTPVLCFPNFSKPFILYIVVSIQALGATLSQSFADSKHLVHYTSWIPNYAERN